MNIDTAEKTALRQKMDKDTLAMIGSKPLIIFGSGNLGKKIAAFLLSEKHNVAAFADNSAARWGQSVNSIPVISPGDAIAMNGGDVLFIVSIWSPGNSYVGVKEQLQGIGAKHIIHAALLMQLFPDALLPHYHFQLPRYFLDHQKELNAVYDLLNDEESKKQYAAHIDCRINLNFDGLPEPDIHNQYFPHGLIALGKDEVFFDGGAYDGDTLRSFTEHTGGSFKRYIALEPDPSNNVKLQNTIDSLQLNNVVVFPYAVGGENAILKFDATGGGGAGISDNGTMEVECIRLDDRFRDEAFTYLKFDIEGAELGALKGAEKIITTHRPKIAVCIYHLPDDLWTIPLYLKDRFPFYNLYVRSHQFDGLDLVLYAIPGE